MKRSSSRRSRLRAARASRRYGAGSLAALALLAAGAGCGATGGERTTAGSSATAAASVSPAQPPASVVARPQPAQLRAFALLRSRPEPLPAPIRRYVRPPAPGANLLLAQRLRVPLADAYWLVPADGYLCIVRERAVDEAALNVCTPNAQAVRHGVAMATILPPTQGQRRLIVGVAPDGTSTARIHTGSNVSTAAVEQTLFVVRDALTDPPERIDML